MCSGQQWHLRAGGRAAGRCVKVVQQWQLVHSSQQLQLCARDKAKGRCVEVVQK